MTYINAMLYVYKLYLYIDLGIVIDVYKFHEMLCTNV